MRALFRWRRHDASATGDAAPAGRRLRRWGANAALAAGMTLATAMLLPALLGYERYVITGDSMGGDFARGSIAYARAVPVEELRVGDVITYDPPAKSHADGLVTHRIVEIERGSDGEPVFRTAGDANGSPDPWRFRLEHPTQARAELSVPLAGYAFAALGIRWVRVVLIGLPALAIAVSLLAGLWREAGRHAEERREGALSGETPAVP